MDTATWSLLISALALSVSLWNAWRSKASEGHSRVLNFLDEHAAVLVDLREQQENLRRNAIIAGQILAAVPHPLKSRVQQLVDDYDHMETNIEFMRAELRKKVPTDVAIVPLEAQLQMRRIWSLQKTLSADTKALEARLKLTLATAKTEYGIVTDSR